MQLILLACSFVLLMRLDSTNGLYCFSCANVQDTMDCDTIRECGSHETCYTSQYITSSGHIYHELGCKDQKQCASAGTIQIVGKRDTGDVLICDQCCSTPLCQETQCGGSSVVGRGPLCFNCHTAIGADCNHVTVCGRDEVCLKSLSTTHSDMYNTGCFSKRACTVMASSPDHLANAQCFSCCDSDLCNVDCTMPITTNAPQAGTTAACVDSTPEATCQLASSIVCSDTTHATNANCLHYCGFC